jgi:hypothetical protein
VTKRQTIQLIKYITGKNSNNRLQYYIKKKKKNYIYSILIIVDFISYNQKCRLPTAVFAV